MKTEVACVCGRHFSAPAELAGRTVKCPGCAEPLTIPPSQESKDSAPGPPKADEGLAYDLAEPAPESSAPASSHTAPAGLQTKPMWPLHDRKMFRAQSRGALTTWMESDDKVSLNRIWPFSTLSVSFVGEYMGADPLWQPVQSKNVPCPKCKTPLCMRADWSPALGGLEIWQGMSICVQCTHRPCMIDECDHRATTPHRHFWHVAKGVHIRNDVWTCDYHAERMRWARLARLVSLILLLLTTLGIVLAIAENSDHMGAGFGTFVVVAIVLIIANKVLRLALGLIKRSAYQSVGEMAVYKDSSLF